MSVGVECEYERIEVQFASFAIRLVEDVLLIDAKGRRLACLGKSIELVDCRIGQVDPTAKKL